MYDREIRLLHITQLKSSLSKILVDHYRLSGHSLWRNHGGLAGFDNERTISEVLQSFPLFYRHVDLHVVGR